MRYFVYTDARGGECLKWEATPNLINSMEIEVMKSEHMEDYETEEVPTTEEMLNKLCEVVDGGYPGEWFEVKCNNGKIERV